MGLWAWHSALFKKRGNHEDEGDEEKPDDGSKRDLSTHCQTRYSYGSGCLSVPDAGVDW